MPKGISYGDKPMGRFCQNCGRRIPMSQRGDLCNDCLRIKLFPEVKEYVNNNDVNEVDVAAHFNIPRSLVNEWVSEGRLEHKRKL